MKRQDPADHWNQKGIALEEKGRVREAERAYLKAAKADPGWSWPWFNLGLLAKRQRRWRESMEWNRRAVALDPSAEGGWWNLGIAATALGEWAEARRAWSGFGIKIPEGDGPLDLNLGLTPVRVSPAENPEVVWCHRIDPARAYVRSVPLPDSGRRFDDLLLHDGEPKGTRWLGDQQVSVFDELELLTPSAFSTYQVICTVLGPDDLDALERLGHDTDLKIEDWSESIEILCKACSEGTPHEHSEREERGWQPERRLGLAAKSDREVDDLLARWGRERPGCEILEVSLVLAAA